MQIIFFILGCFIIFLIIAGAVKMGTREALNEFKEDLFQELKLLSIEASKLKEKQ